jgi:NADPH-dependent F420 reductase
MAFLFWGKAMRAELDVTGADTHARGEDDMARIAIIGGTGPEGLGLALRFTLAGEDVRIGSRDGARARAAAVHGNTRLAAAGSVRRISGDENRATIDGADIVVLALPYAAVGDILPQLAPRLDGKMVLDVVNPLARVAGEFRMAAVAAGSAAEEIQARLPRAQVVSAFKSESAEHLNNIPASLAGDVLVASDHADARACMLDLVRRIPHLRAVDAGALVNARSLEAITPLLLNLNRRHGAVTSIQILGLDRNSGQRAVGSGQCRRSEDD